MPETYFPEITDLDRQNAADILTHLDIQSSRATAIRSGQADDDWLIHKMTHVRAWGWSEGAVAIQWAASRIVIGKVLAHGLSDQIHKIKVDWPRKVEP